MNNMKHYDLMIVGNGFDLHLGYQTKYRDFCLYLFRHCQPIENKLLYFFCNAFDNGYLFNEDWTSFEQLLCQYLEFLNYLFTDQNISFSFEKKDNGMTSYYLANLIVKDINKMPINCLRILDISNPLDDYVDYYFINNGHKSRLNGRLSSYPNIGNELIISIRKIFKMSPSTDELKTYLINIVNNLLNGVEKELAKYIKKTTERSISESCFLLENFGKKVGKVLSFNYSRTTEKIFSLKETDVAYVHGNFDGNIVLGIEDGMIEKQTISESTSMFAPFFKRSRRFIKKCNEHFKNKILDSIAMFSEIAIFGHSLDKSDKSIFDQVFSLNFQHCDIYYYGEETDYRVKLINLIGANRVEELNNEGKISFIPINNS